MIRFKPYNANPKGKKTSDCVTRALASVLDCDWQDALLLQYQTASKTGWAMNDKRTEDKILKQYGYVKQKQPKKADGSKYTLRELDKLTDVYSYPVYVTVQGHATCVLTGIVYDTWDCRDYVIRNYWIYEGEEK